MNQAEIIENTYGKMIERKDARIKELLKIRQDTAKDVIKCLTSALNRLDKGKTFDVSGLINDAIEIISDNLEK